MLKVVSLIDRPWPWGMVLPLEWGGVGEGVVGAYLADMGLGFRGWHH